jgi:HSP20 family protein
MNKLMRYNPFAELDALQKQFFGSDVWAPIKAINIPTTDIYTRDDKEMIVEAQLPNFTEDDINVSVDENYLIIQAERHEKEEEEGEKKKKYVIRESSSSLYRRVYLPERADGDAIQAHFKDGLLTVTIPFKELPQPKKIVIAGKTSAKKIK